MKLTLLEGTYNISRLDPHLPVPAWCLQGDFFSVTRTMYELSVVCRAQFVPPGTKTEAGWCRLEVEGPLDFSLTGILASLSGALAHAGVSLFAVSTYDTDYILVKDVQAAIRALTAAGHVVARL